jgi:hypothetical protein
LPEYLPENEKPASDRTDEMARFKHFLSSPDGEAFVNELELTWDKFDLMGGTPEETAYNVGLRDAFKFIKMLQNGELIHE